MVVKLKIFVAIVAMICFANLSCAKKNNSSAQTPNSENPEPTIVTPAPAPAAENIEACLNLLKGKRIGAVVNHTSMVGETHLVDTLLKLGIRIEKIYAPEHGFRGTASAGEHVKDGKDAATGIPLISLYGSKKKPGREELANIDLVLFDIQDVGARFYTYISTMSYVMEACAEKGLPMLVLDRPNPNGHYVDGPVLQKKYSSFVGLHEVPVVHGMTVGEYARMVNGEGWLAGGVQCDLTVIPCENYDHKTRYELPVKPSPNLPNMRAIYLYPSICFFEGTEVSVGRGTDKQFQVLGAPGFSGGDFTFIPKPMEGAQNPPHEGKTCRGFDLTVLKTEDLRQRNSLDLSYLFTFYNGFDNKEGFFLKNLFFDKLAGGTELRQQIIAGKTEVEIRESWQPGLERFMAIRKKYLLYPDF
jgi:uncharacterized protein YbbC (DUF1343 family)